MPTIRDLTLAVSGGSWTDAAVTVGYRLEFSEQESSTDGTPPRFEEWIEILADEPGGGRRTLVHTPRPSRLPAATGAPLSRTRRVLLPTDPGRRPRAPRPSDAPTVRPGDTLLAVIEIRPVGSDGSGAGSRSEPATRAVGQTGPVPGWR